MTNKIKILCIGNSFSIDTMKRAPEVAPALGIELVVGNLFIPGCPISRHYNNIANDLPAYTYYHNDCGEWTETPEYKISDAIRSDDWDVISIQHGSSGGQSYIRPECYDDFPALVQTVKSLAPKHTKIVFNITWPAEVYHHHRDLRTHTGSQLSLMNNIIRITKELVATNPDIYCTIPTGLAIQNARTTVLRDRMSRDGYHLSYEHGRYLASMTFLKALTGVSLENISWRPEVVTAEEQALLIKAANMALADPDHVRTII